jgi:hypothetical protein
MAKPPQLHRASTRLLSGVMAILGVVILVTTLVRGGGPLAVGVVVGVAFCVVGAGRLWLDRGAP